MSDLTWNRYGKSRIRLVKVRRARDPHELVDLTIDVQLEGAFETVYVAGDNGPCLATDTMKNTVYAMARQHPIDHVGDVRVGAGRSLPREAVGLARPDQHRRAAVGTPVVRRDSRIRTRSSRPARSIGRRSSRATRAAPRWSRASRTWSCSRRPTRRSRAFPAIEYTTLPDTEDRIMATSMTAAWTYRPEASDFSARGRRCAGRWSRHLRRTSAARCSTRCTRWAKRRWRRAPT